MVVEGEAQLEQQPALQDAGGHARVADRAEQDRVVALELGEHLVRQRLAGGVVAAGAEVVLGALHLHVLRQRGLQDLEGLGGDLDADAVAGDHGQPDGGGCCHGPTVDNVSMGKLTSVRYVGRSAGSAAAPVQRLLQRLAGGGSCLGGGRRRSSGGGGCGSWRTPDRVVMRMVVVSGGRLRRDSEYSWRTTAVRMACGARKTLGHPTKFCLRPRAGCSYDVRPPRSAPLVPLRRRSAASARAAKNQGL